MRGPVARLSRLRVIGRPIADHAGRASVWEAGYDDAVCKVFGT
jgi:hypothetical protein